LPLHRKRNTSSRLQQRGGLSMRIRRSSIRSLITGERKSREVHIWMKRILLVWTQPGGEYAFRYTCENDNYTEQLEFGRDDWFDPENYSAAYEKGAKQYVSDLLEVYREWYGEDCIFGTGSIDISGTECWWIDYRTTADDDGPWFRYYELYIPVDSRGQNDKFLYSFDGSDTENIGHYLSVRQALINSITITE